jgi:hypothetical protein
MVIKIKEVIEGGFYVMEQTMPKNQCLNLLSIWKEVKECL